jgi:AraC-like DNA-binding protein
VRRLVVTLLLRYAAWMSKLATSDVRFRRPRHLPGVEVLTAAYSHRRFPEHSHDEYVVGAIVAGAERLTVEGRPHIAASGDVLRLHPDEPHANSTVGGEPLGYRVLYLPAGVIRPLLAPERVQQGLTFETPVVQSPAIFRLVNQVHAVLSDGETDQLEQESALAGLVRGVAAPVSTRGRPACAASTVAGACKAYIDDHFTEGFGLQALCGLTGLSASHLVRSFKTSIGLSPVAYRNQRRVMAARLRLLAGQPIAQVALDMGYADQSHLTRQFQRILGVSPGRYAQQ